MGGVCHGKEENTHSYSSRPYLDSIRGCFKRQHDVVIPAKGTQEFT